MSLIKKSDVKNHLSARHHNRIHLASVSYPDATGFSGTNQVPIETDRPGFSQDFTGDHTTSGAGLGSSAETSAASTPQASTDSGLSKL